MSEKKQKQKKSGSMSEDCSIKELKQTRIELGVRQIDIAPLLGLSQVTLSSRERGQTYTDSIFRRRYKKLLVNIEKGKVDIPRNNGKVVNCRSREHGVLPSDIRSLDTRRKKMGLSYQRLGYILGRHRTVISRDVKQGAMSQLQYVEMVNALYDMETGGMYTTLTEQEARNVLNDLVSYSMRLNRVQRLSLKLREFEELLSLSAQNYQGARPSAGQHSDPVARRYERIERLKRELERMRERIRPIQEVYGNLKNSGSVRARQIYLLFEHRYLGHEAMSVISEETGIPVRTLYRREHELIMLVYKAEQDMHRKEE